LTKNHEDSSSITGILKWKSHEDSSTVNGYLIPISESKYSNPTKDQPSDQARYTGIVKYYTIVPFERGHLFMKQSL
jgi:hypothetical protein